MGSGKKEKIVHSLINIFNHMKRSSFLKSLNTTSIRPSEIIVMSNLAKLSGNAEKGIKVSDFSGYMQVTPAAITHIIDLLVEKGLVERRADPDDRRIVLISPTKKGLETARDLEEKINIKIGGLVDFLGEKDSKEFVRLLSSVSEYFDKNQK
jgi:DNA-binding MarR family transcriptional regulator